MLKVKVIAFAFIAVAVGLSGIAVVVARRVAFCHDCLHRCDQAAVCVSATEQCECLPIRNP